MYNILCAFYVLLATQPCTLQHISPCFKFQLHFIKLNEEVLLLQPSCLTMHVAIKWQQWAQRQAETLAYNMQLLNTRQQKRRHCICRHLDLLCQGEWNLISSPTNLVLFHSSSRVIPSCDNSCLCQLTHY